MPCKLCLAPTLSSMRCRTAVAFVEAKADACLESVTNTEPAGEEAVQHTHNGGIAM